ncbi:MAG: phosphoglucosamine mutase [Candidatus Sumerlaeia bacterium]|nr:phosphoglucosamine mutase [Candidatus Sumerlaeia bacterium]
MTAKPASSKKKTAKTKVAAAPAEKSAPKKPRTAARKKTKPEPNATSPLMVTISGVRGIAGDALTPLTVTRYTMAFARLIDAKRVVVGHDVRPSGRWILPIIEGVLRSMGIDVVIVGLNATPTVGLLVRKLKADGGIIVTASHNPIEYNGMKFFHSGGEFITAEMLESLKRHLEKVEKSPPLPTYVGKKAVLADAAEYHLRALLSALPPPERVRASQRPTVIIDCCNSCGVELAPDVADAYGALFQLLHADTTKYTFPRGAEPIEENIRALRQAVVKENAGVGFALDPDADRLALVDENGNALGEERTFLLAADAYLSMAKRKTPLIVNLSTTMAVEDLAAKHRVSVHRTAIGEANVMAGIRKYKARIGGEGNGGVIFPAVHPGRDAATGIALILIGLQNLGISLSEWNAQFPVYTMRKDSIPLEGGITARQAISRISRSFSREKKDTTDGLKVIFSDRWLHVRPSNTEPIIRLFAEAHTPEEADSLIERAKGLVQ